MPRGGHRPNAGRKKKDPAQQVAQAVVRSADDLVRRINASPGPPKLTNAGKGRKKGSKNKASVDVRRLCQRLVGDPVYMAELAKRLNSGKVAPAVETMIWHYGYGRPVETIELAGKGGGPIKHQVRITIVSRAA